MSEIAFEHGVGYDPVLLEQPVRALLAGSQTNVARGNVEVGLAHAAAAYDLTFLQPEIHESDRTARGEAAAKAGLWSELADAPVERTDLWFEHALRELPLTGDPSYDRECASAFLLLGRTLKLRMDRADDPEVRDMADIIDEPMRWNGIDARAAFGIADRILRDHHVGSRWDRYGTMNLYHWALYEAPYGSSGEAMLLAARGLGRAITAKREGRPLLSDHLPFVAKHVGRNALAGFAAL